MSNLFFWHPSYRLVLIMRFFHTYTIGDVFSIHILLLWLISFSFVTSCMKFKKTSHVVLCIILDSSVLVEAVFVSLMWIVASLKMPECIPECEDLGIKNFALQSCCLRQTRLMFILIWKPVKWFFQVEVVDSNLQGCKKIFKSEHHGILSGVCESVLCWCISAKCFYFLQFVCHIPAVLHL